MRQAVGSPAEGAPMTAMTPEEIRKLRGERSRAEFARRLGVSPLTVYRWELPEGATESRRPRGTILSRLLHEASRPPEETSPGRVDTFEGASGRVDPPEGASGPPSPRRAAPPSQRAPTAPHPLAPEDELLLLPLLSRLLAGQLGEVERALVGALVGNRLTSLAGRALATALLAQTQALSTFDGRAAYASLGTLLRDADAGLLPPLVELHVRVAASFIFSSYDAQLLDIGKVNAAIDRGDKLCEAVGSPDVRFLLLVGLAASSLQGEARDWGQGAAARLMALGETLTEPLPKLFYDEIQAHGAYAAGRRAVAVRAYEEVAARAAAIGLTAIEVRCLTFLARARADEFEPPESLLALAHRVRTAMWRGRLRPGLHSAFLTVTEANALLRLGRIEEAAACQRAGIEESKHLGLGANPLIPTTMRLVNQCGVGDLLEPLLEALAADRSPAGRISVRLLRAAQAIGEGQDRFDELDEATRVVESAHGHPHWKLGSTMLAYEARVLYAGGQGAAELERPFERLLALQPAPHTDARFKRAQAIECARRGGFVEAEALFQGALATFTSAHDQPEVAWTRLWLARLQVHLRRRHAAEELEERKRACEALGLRLPPEVPFGEGRAAPRPGPKAGSGPRPLAAYVDRLALRGLSHETILRELAAACGELFGPQAAVINEVADEVGPARARPERQAVGEWFEFGDGAGRHFRLGLRKAPGPEGRDLARVLATVTGLALEVSSLRGLGGALDEDDARPAELEGFVAVSPALRRLREEVARLAASTATVLLLGESGSGKEVFARALHTLSRRSAERFVAFNCAAVPHHLFEGQIFGHRKGSFTGATSDSQGVVRAAHGGTLFLDEIGELPLDVQPKLLRFLENREVTPLGDVRPVPVDVRVVTATHRDLVQLVREGRFREDLYYRLNVVPLRIPPLRERPEDIAPLARHFARQLSGPQTPPPVLAPDALAALANYPWPGNVRELRNIIERALAFSPPPPVLTSAHLGGLGGGPRAPRPVPPPSFAYEGTKKIGKPGGLLGRASGRPGAGGRRPFSAVDEFEEGAEHVVGCLGLRIVPDAGQQHDVGPGHAGAVVRREVRARDGVFGAVDEAHGARRGFDRADPARAVPTPLFHVTNQERVDEQPALALDEAPEARELVGRRPRAGAEDGAEAPGEAALVDEPREQRADGAREQLLHGPRPVHLGVEASVQQAGVPEIEHARRALAGAGEQLLGDGVAVVVGEHPDAAHAELGEQPLDEIGLVGDAIVVRSRLRREAVPDEIGRDDAKAADERGPELVPVPRRRGKAMNQHQGRPRPLVAVEDALAPVPIRAPRALPLVERNRHRRLPPGRRRW
jgi:Sigma-54 interaction domain